MIRDAIGGIHAGDHGHLAIGQGQNTKPNSIIKRAAHSLRIHETRSNPHT